MNVNNQDSEKLLLDRIIASAEAEAAKTEDSAEEYAKKVLSDAERSAEEYISARKKVAEDNAEKLISRRKTVADLEAKKTYLAAKQALVEEVFARAEKKLCLLPEKKYLAFVEKLINAYAEKGDKVVLSENCPIDTKAVLALDRVKTLSLAVEKTGKFGGGLVLSGEKVDKDLTFGSICAAYREKTQADIAAKLFG